MSLKSSSSNELSFFNANFSRFFSFKAAILSSPSEAEHSPLETSQTNSPFSLDSEESPLPAIFLCILLDELFERPEEEEALEDDFGERPSRRAFLVGGGDLAPYSSSSDDSRAASAACKFSILQKSEIMKDI